MPPDLLDFYCYCLLSFCLSFIIVACNNFSGFDKAVCVVVFNKYFHVHIMSYIMKVVSRCQIMQVLGNVLEWTG